MLPRSQQQQQSRTRRNSNSSLTIYERTFSSDDPGGRAAAHQSNTRAEQSGQVTWPPPGNNTASHMAQWGGSHGLLSCPGKDDRKRRGETRRKREREREGLGEDGGKCSTSSEVLQITRSLPIKFPIIILLSFCHHDREEMARGRYTKWRKMAKRMK